MQNKSSAEHMNSSEISPVPAPFPAQHSESDTDIGSGSGSGSGKDASSALTTTSPVVISPQTSSFAEHEKHVQSHWQEQKNMLIAPLLENTTRYQKLGVPRAQFLDAVYSKASDMLHVLGRYMDDLRTFYAPSFRSWSNPFSEPGKKSKQSMHFLCDSIVSSSEDSVLDMSVRIASEKMSPLARHHFHRALVRATSRTLTRSLTSPFSCSSVFALPAYGNIDMASHALIKISPARLRDIAEESGCLHHSADAFVLPAPFRTSALSSPSFLKGLCDLAIDAPHIEELYPEQSSQIISERVSRLAGPFLAHGGTGDFVFVGVRTVSGSFHDVLNRHDLSFDWYQSSSIAQCSSKATWSVLMQGLLAQGNVLPGSLFVRPPVPVPIAQAQAAAWSAVHEIYTNLRGKICRYLCLVELPCGGAQLEARESQTSKTYLARSEIIPMALYNLCPEAFQDVVREEYMMYRSRSLDRDMGRL